MDGHKDYMHQAPKMRSKMMSKIKRPLFRRVWIGIKGTKPKRYKRGWQRIRRTVSWRKKIKRAMNWGLAHTGAIHYQQARPFNPDSIHNRDLPLYIDCSASTTQLYKDAGRPDPNGRDYNGTGNTETLRANTPKRKSLSSARVGDFIVYGPDGRPDLQHVVVVYARNGNNPKVWSHGQEAGPLLNTHAIQVGAHGSHFTVHNGGLLKHESD